MRTLPDEFPEAHGLINDMRLEYVVLVEGTVRSRPNESVNKKMKTGFVEVCLLISAQLHFKYPICFGFSRKLMCVVCCIR